MKHSLRFQKRFLALLVAIVMGMGTAFAADFSAVCSTGQTLYYNIIDAANNYVEITCPGTTSAFGWDGYTKPTGNITLPSNVTYNGNTYTVKRIGQYAFVGCSGLTGSLSIPNSVTEIGRAAFNVCKGFTGQLTLGNSVTTIGVGAFMTCEGISGLLTIPNSVTTIDDKAFYLCSGITSMTVLPETPPTLGHFVFDDVTTSIPVYVPCGSLSAYQNAFGWSEFSNIQGTGCSSLTYSINDDGVSVTVTGHVDGTSATGSLSIPMTTTIDGVTYTVTAIGNSAFKNCSGLTGSLSIPNSVTSIGNSAFYHCTGFTGQLIIPNSVTTIGSFAFYCCTGFTGSLTIPNSVTSIGSYAFYYLNGLTGSLKIGNAVTSISNYAFAYCRSLSGSLTIGYSVTTIGDRAFQECYNVTSITVLPETPPTLGTSVFQSVPTDILVEVPCESLEDYQTASGWSAFTNIQCRETLTYSVNYNGVYYYVSVTGHVDGTAAVGRITIPSTKTIDGVTYTVSTIERYAFRNCTGLTGPLIIPESVTTIEWNAFDNCSGFTGSLTIPNSVTTIYSDAFRNCTGFTGSLTISNSVTIIASGAFDNCSGFTGSLTIPNSVNEIYEDAFRNCSGFTGSLTIPNSVTTIGSDAFNGCTGFTGSLTIGSSVTTIGERAFHNCSGFTGSLTIPNSVNSIDLYAFRNCTGFDGTLTIGNSLTTIGYGAFSHCSGFTGSLTIPNSVTTIGTEAFYGCSGFTGSLTIPNSVTTIGNYTFENCTGFDGTLTIGNSVTTIGSDAFRNCNGFTGSLIIPNSVTSIGNHAFDNCTGFDGTLTIGNSLTSIGYGTFSDCSGFTGSLTIGSSVTSIGGLAFYHCSGFTGSLTIPNSVTQIDGNAFDGCSGFTGSLTIPNSVTTIGNYTFENCTGFDGTLTIGNSLTTIGYGAFSHCSGFTGSLTIPNSVTTIQNKAFQGCSGLTGLTLGSSVATIGEQAFYNCSGFASLTALPVTPPTLGTNAFYNVTATIPVYVFCESLDAYQAASDWSAFTNMQCLPELTVYDGTITNSSIPADIIYFDEYTRSQFVIPASALSGKAGSTFYSMTFYTLGTNVPYTTVSSADVYLKEVDYTSISAYEPKSSATTVYSGLFNIVSAGSGGEMTIYFDSPYTYHGGNLLVGVENTETNGWKSIGFKGQTVTGASISGSNASITGAIPAEQQNFIPKTTFTYVRNPKTLPYTYGFEEEDEFECWTMLNCDEHTGRIRGSNDVYNGNYGFRFYYTTNPPQYLISPELECTTDVDVSFYYRNESGYMPWPETFQVGYSTTTKLPDAFTWGEELTAEDSEWTHYENTFPAGTRYVAIKHLSYDQNVFCVDEFSFIPAASSVTQTTDLAEGWNWFSTYIEMDDPTDLLLMLEESIGENGVQIKNADYYTAYEDEEWFGDLDDEGLFNEQMYKILVVDDCTVVLEGMKANPEDHGIDIEEGWNWIGFPVSEEVAIEDAFADFDAEEGDVIKNSEDYTSFEDGEWFGDLEDMTPGQGYMYFSNSDESKTLIYQTTSKAYRINKK